MDDARAAVRQSENHAVPAGTDKPSPGAAKTRRPLKAVSSEAEFLLFSSPLNDAYTFDQLVVGTFNQLAISAAKAVLREPGKVYNPLFVHAGIGLGKTHLLQALTHAFLTKRPQLRACYLTLEAFGGYMQAAERGGYIPELQNALRTLDVLLIDDVQDLADNPMIQKELLHTFDAQYDAHCQIILSADAPPGSLEVMERLSSRFKCGLVLEISDPSPKCKLIVAGQKAAKQAVNLPGRVLDMIVQKAGNVREIESALLKVIGYAALLKVPVDEEITAEVLNLEKTQPKLITVDTIQETVSRYYGLTPEDLQSRTRTRSLTFPRQISIYLSRQLTDYPLEALGGFFGGRDHSTVKHSINKIRAELEQSRELKNTLRELRRLIIENCG